MCVSYRMTLACFMNNRNVCFIQDDISESSKRLTQRWCFLDCKYRNFRHYCTSGIPLEFQRRLSVVYGIVWSTLFPSEKNGFSWHYLSMQWNSMAHQMEIGLCWTIFHDFPWKFLKFHDIPSLFHGLPWKLLIRMENLGIGWHKYKLLYF